MDYMALAREQNDFITRLAAERGVPTSALRFVDYGREIQDAATGATLARRSHRGWAKIGVDNQVLEEIAHATSAP